MDWCLPPLFIVLALSVPCLRADKAVQSSTWNSLDSSLTLDGDPGTCALTGYHSYSWYVLDMGTTKTVNKIYINGVGLKNVFLTVGDNGRTDGHFRGFTNNHDCNVVKDALVDNTQNTIDCFNPVTGRYITMEMLSEEDVPHRMNICEFAYTTI